MYCIIFSVGAAIWVMNRMYFSNALNTSGMSS